MYLVEVENLKERLGDYVRIAAAGDRVLITNLGRVVAELIPVRAGTESSNQRPAGRVPWLIPLSVLLAELDADRADR